VGTDGGAHRCRDPRVISQQQGSDAATQIVASGSKGATPDLYVPSAEILKASAEDPYQRLARDANR